LSLADAIAGFFVNETQEDPVEQDMTRVNLMRKNDMGAGYPSVTLQFTPSGFTP